MTEPSDGPDAGRCDGHVIGRAVTAAGVLPNAYVAWADGVITGAKAAGFADRGTIAVGKRADLLLCDDAPARNPAPRDGRAPTPPTVITAGKRKER